MQSSSHVAPITVGIPTYCRGELVFKTLDRVLACNPKPAEIIVHVDASDGILEQRLKAAFPTVHILSSQIRRGPGGGRHQCLLAASQPFFASFDDDSWPVDEDYFQLIIDHFAKFKGDGALEATIFHQNQKCPELTNEVRPISSYTGCGHAMRVEAYRQIIGYIDRAIPYGIEETDVSLQLFAKGWQIQECGNLRVYHDTRLTHHVRADITASTIANAALFCWLRYPLRLWPYALLQYGHVIYFMFCQRRFSGLLEGILQTPLIIWQYRHQRAALSYKIVVSYLRSRPRLRSSRPIFEEPMNEC